MSSLAFVTSPNLTRGDTAASANSVPIRGPAGEMINNQETCSQIICTGCVSVAWNAKSASYPITWSTTGAGGGDHAIYLDTTAGSATLTLPPPATVGPGGMLRLIKKVAANSMIINPNAAELINGAASKTVTAIYTIVTLFCDGTNWIAGTMTVL